MMSDRNPKKGETLEIRLPYQAKTDFMARCRDQGRTASDAVRAFIDGELAGRRPARNGRSVWVQALAAAVAGLAIGALAAPSAAQAMRDDQAAFRHLDQNGDGVLSAQEFSAR